MINCEGDTTHRVSEIAWKQCKQILMMNSLTMPSYYGTLFASFKALIDKEHIDELDKQIKEIEVWLSDDLNQMTLDEVEMRMFQNMDLLSGFEVKGQMITQMEINQRLEQIKTWLTQLLYIYLPYIRFTQAVRMD